MRRRLVCLFLISLLAGACGPGLADDASGAEIYSASCARCHGADLAGSGVVPALGAGSAAAELDDDALLLTIDRGRGRMPSFGSQLSAEQMDRVVAYLREQQG